MEGECNKHWEQVKPSEEKQEEEGAKSMTERDRSVRSNFGDSDDSHAMVAVYGTITLQQQPFLCGQGSLGSRLLTPAQMKGVCCDGGVDEC